MKHYMCFDHCVQFSDEEMMCPDCERELCNHHDSLTETEITYKGSPVVISVEYVTGSDDTFWGSQYIGEYVTLEGLNEDLPEIIKNIPSENWEVRISFNDGRFK